MSQPKKQPKEGQSITRFFGSFGTGLIIFFGLIALYSFISGGSTVPASVISLSELSTDITKGSVSTITIDGDTLSATYKDGIEKTSKKESDSALTATLVNYGVTAEQISAVKIDVKEPSGFGYWVANLAPVIIPLIFVGFCTIFV
jgi:ATP-dependent Zn protease